MRKFGIDFHLAYRYNKKKGELAAKHKIMT